MRFPPSFLERLRSQITLSEVIGRRITLKKHGREFQACCPFHNEKTPSFTVNDEKNFFHCFGCAAHGDAIGFVMRHDRLTYPEAIEKLARDLGIPMPVMTRDEVHRAEQEKTQLSVLEAACRWFESQLATHISARQYAERRGLARETLQNFRIGFAPDERNSLSQFLSGAGYSIALQQEAGLIGRSEEGHVYDRFRGRLIFPIRSARGDVVAFGGRLIAEPPPGKQLPKYLNSPETPLFKKGEMLYNLDLARRPAREKECAIVLEGYMDVVSVAQSGVDYAVATLGTAVTPEHIKKLWQLCKEPVLCLDGDSAGLRAMSRAAEIVLPLLKPGYSLRFAILPANEDPDSYIRKFGKNSFENILGSAQPLYQSLWEDIWQRHKSSLGQPEGRAEFETACKLISERISDPTVKKHYSDYFESQLWEHVRKAPRVNIRRSAQVTQLVNLEDPTAAALDRLTLNMLRILISFPPLLHKSAVEETLSRLDPRDAKIAALKNALMLSIEQTGLEEKEALMAFLERTLPGHAMPPMPAAQRTLSLEDAGQLWSEAVRAYEISRLQSELKQLQQGINEHFDETMQKRLFDLQDALKKAQSSRTFAPMAVDPV